jgi:DNA mismatch repair protein MutS
MVDLSLGPVVDAILAGRREYALRPLFQEPLSDPDAVEFRHEVFRDLEMEDARTAVLAFAHEMRRVRRCLGMVQSRRYPFEQQRWLLDAAALYCSAVSALVDALAAVPLRSRGMRSARERLSAYAVSGPFRSLSTDVEVVLAGLSDVRYTVLIDGARVTVSRYDGQADYTAEVERTFARFREARSTDHLAKVVDSGAMDHIEARIADRVARLYPLEFHALAGFWQRHRDLVDVRVSTFDREVQFYLAVIEHVESLGRSGIAFCYPVVSTDPNLISAEAGVDVALAMRASTGGDPIVPNDFALRGSERILVVTGPNQGGKTTFARMIGQLHYLASLGIPVAARSATLLLADRVLTHFPRVEHVSSLRGRLENELLLARTVLGDATPRSLIVMNEIFGSTTLDDARALGSRILARIGQIGCPAVCVTFVDELSDLGPASVSMVAMVAPDDPSTRTFRIERAPADGRAYALALAEKYGLSYERLQNRIAP